MRRSMKAVVAGTILTVVFSGCFSPFGKDADAGSDSTGAGTVVLTLGEGLTASSSGAMVPAVRDQIAEYEVVFTSDTALPTPDGPVVGDITDPDQAITVTVPPGEWIVFARAYRADGEPAARSDNQTVSVDVDQTQSLPAPLLVKPRQLPGTTGSAALEVSVPVDAVSSVTNVNLFPRDDQTVPTTIPGFDLTSSTSLSWSMPELPVGRYVLTGELVGTDDNGNPATRSYLTIALEVFTNLESQYISAVDGSTGLAITEDQISSPPEAPTDLMVSASPTYLSEDPPSNPPNAQVDLYWTPNAATASGYRVYVNGVETTPLAFIDFWAAQNIPVPSAQEVTVEVVAYNGFGESVPVSWTGTVPAPSGQITAAFLDVYTVSNSAKSSVPAGRISAIEIDGSTVAVASATGGGIGVSSDGGATWSHFTRANGLTGTFIVDVELHLSRIYISYEYSYTVDVLSFNGTEWVFDHTLDFNDGFEVDAPLLEAVGDVGNEVLYLATTQVAPNATVVRYEYQSSTKTDLSADGVVGAAGSFFDLYGHDDTGELYAIDNAGRLYHRALTGSFVEITAATPNTTFQLIDGSGTTVVATSTGGISVYDGTNWTLGSNPAGIDLVDNFPTALSVSSGSIYLGAPDEQLYRSTDSAVTWASTTNAPGIDSGGTIDTLATSDEIVWLDASADSTGVLVSSNAGTTWSEYAATDGMAADELDSLFYDGNYLVVGNGELAWNNAGFSVSLDKGASWKPYDLNSGYGGTPLIFQFTYHDPDGVIYIANGDQFLPTLNPLNETMTTTDGPLGGYFSAVASSGTQVALTGQYSSSVAIGPGVTSGMSTFGPLDQDWSSFEFGVPIHAAPDGSFYFVSPLDGVARTADNGATWTTWPLGDVFFESTEIFAVASNGTRVFVAANQGLWVSDSNGQAATWNLSLGGGASGLPNSRDGVIRDIAVVGDTVVVATDLGPYLSLDAGSTFSPLDPDWSFGSAAEVEWLGTDILITTQQGLVHYIVD
jgi:hypothetical protein